MTLSGDLAANEVTTPSGSLTTICSSSSYVFVVSKSTDATYNFNLKTNQRRSWFCLRQSILVSGHNHPPPPSSQNRTLQIFMQRQPLPFNANQTGSTFECKLDSGSYAGCASGINYSSLSNGVHTFYVRSTDPVGNTEVSPASYTWTQAAYNTVALYHFDTGAETTDSSSYTGSYNNSSHKMEVLQHHPQIQAMQNLEPAELFSFGLLASPNSPTTQNLTTQTMTFEACEVHIISITCQRHHSGHCQQTRL